MAVNTLKGSAMNGLSKPFYFKLLVAAVAAFVFISTPIYAQEKESPTLFNKSKKNESSKKIMKRVSWNSSKPKEKAEEYTNDTAKIKEKTKGEAELTDDQKLWKKYKDLAEGNGGKYKTNKGEAVSEESKTKEESKAKAEVKKKESPVGIRAIIENYKKSQENKGKMNSRSFGKIN